MSDPLYDGNGYDAAMEYVKNHLKYARIGECTQVEINMPIWPTEVMDLPVIKNSPLMVEISDTTYQGFYESMKSGNGIKHLEIRKSYDEDKEPFTIPTQFFQSDFFQNLSTFDCLSLLPEIPNDCFLSMKATKVMLMGTTLSDRLINKKILQWFNNPPVSPLSYHILNREDKVYNKEVMLDSLPVERLYDTHGLCFDWIVHLRHETGVKARIVLGKGIVIFAVK